MLWILPKRLVASAKPRLPDGVRIYAVGDLHGRSDLLDRVLSHIDCDLERHPTGRAIEVFLGDYIDRGPDSRGVLDRLIERNRSRELVFLKGNHETYVLEFLQNPQVLDEWAQFGGFETLMSYGLKPSMDSISATQEGLAIAFADVLPQSHLRFLKALRLSFSCGDFFFAHAGIKPGVPLIAQKEQHLVSIRDDFLHCEWDHGKIIIHGHTPVREPEVRSNRINIDTGAFATGRLTCLMLERDQAAFIAENRTWLYGPEGKLGKEARLAADPSGKREGSLQPPNEADQPTSDESSRTLQPSAPISDLHSVPPLAQDCSPRPPRMAPGIGGFNISLPPPRDAMEGGIATEPPMEDRRPVILDPAAGAGAEGESALARRGKVVVSMLALLAVAAFVIVSYVDGVRTKQASAIAVLKSLVESEAPTRLIIESPRGAVDEPLPLGITIENATGGETLTITGLADGTELSLGNLSDSLAWTIAAGKIEQTFVGPPSRFVGRMQATASLRSASGRLLDERALRFEWTARNDEQRASGEEPTPGPVSAAANPNPAQTALAVPPTPPQSAEPVQSPQPAAPPNDPLPTAPSLDVQAIRALTDRGQDMLKLGDIATARLLFRRAVLAGSAEAALDLGMTYDPLFLRQLGANGVDADANSAHKWYERARELGSSEASRRIERLASTPRP